MESLVVMSPELIWGLIPRFVGLVYVFAFGSLASQIEQLSGSRGQLPVQQWLARIREDFPGLRRFFEYPTLLWWCRSDRVLRALPIAGIVSGLLAIYGGPIGFVGLVLGWMIWLSLESAGNIFPWDTLLMEVGFLVLFVPTVPALPSVVATELPLPTVTFMVRWLVLRLMLGFGKDKFLGVKHNDSLYLRGFFVWMPLPSPIGWYAHHGPAWFLKLSHFFMFYAEIVAPVLGLFSGWPRLVCYLSMVALMLGIQLTGNWGFFNIAYILLCTCLLDLNASVFDMGSAPWANTWTHWPELGIHIAMGLMFLVSLFYVFNDSWFTRSWVNWPANFYGWKSPGARRAAAIIHRALAPLRAIAPFRIVSGYGVFPPNSTPPLRLTPVFEGSEDGKTWKQYGYRKMPAFADSRPPFLAPGHARFDQATYYFGNGFHAASLFGATMPHSAPHMAHARMTTFHVVAQRLLDGDAVHLDALGHNPFPDAPPKLVRIAMVAMTPTRPGEQHRTGKWWHVRRLGTAMPARGKQPWTNDLLFPRPEQFHPDYIAHKRRAPALRAVLAAHRDGAPLDDAVIAGSDLTADDVRVFWDELVPMLAEQRGDWSLVHARAEAVLARFDVPQLYRLERVLERYAWILRERIAADAVVGPQVDDLHLSNFRQHMIVHESFLDGHDAFAALVQDPAMLIERAKASSDATQLWVLTLLRYDQVMLHIAGFRWCEVGMRAYELEMPGFFEYYPFLKEQVPPGEDFCPQPVLHDDGEHTIEGFYPPPVLHAE